MQETQHLTEPALEPPPRRWWVRVLPPAAAAGVAAGFALVSLAVNWQRTLGVSFPRGSAVSCDYCGDVLHLSSRPAAEAWGVVGAAAAAAVLVTVLVRAAKGGGARPGGRKLLVAAAVAAAVLVAAAVIVAVTTRAWTSAQPAPGFGGAAATVSVIAAAAAGVLTVWSLVTWPGSRPAARVSGVAVAAVAAAVTMTVATAGWDGLSLDATTAAAVPAPQGPVEAAPFHLLWDTKVASLAGVLEEQRVVADGLMIEPADSGGRSGVEAVDLATGRVRWQYLHGDAGSDPVIVASSSVVALFYVGLPAVFLDTATGTPEPLARSGPSFDGDGGGEFMLGRTYLQLDGSAISNLDVTATSAVTGQPLWASGTEDCPARAGAVVDTSDPVQVGSTIAVAYTCSNGPLTNSAARPYVWIIRLALFGPGGTEQEVTLPTPSSPSFSLTTNVNLGLAGAGNTVLVSVLDDLSGGEEAAVDAATGAVLWTKPPVAVDGVLGGGQVVLESSRTSCGRYETASGRLLAAYPAAACAVLYAQDGAVVADGHIYAPQMVGMAPAYLDEQLAVVTIDASTGAILATSRIQPPTWVGPYGGSAPTPSIVADGNTFVFSRSVGPLRETTELAVVAGR